MMMLWFDRHRRLRDQLSAYIDGELAPPAVARLEAHLAECEGCRVETEELRATVAALRDLPQAALPRSFVLSPERAAARRPPQPAVPLAFGMRMAAAGVAVALVAVLVADLGDFGGDGAPRQPAAPQTISGRMAEENALQNMAGGNEPYAGTPAPSGGAATGGSGEQMPETGPDQPAADDAGAALMRDRDAEETPAAGGAPAPAADADAAGAPFAPEEADASEDGGIDALTAAEIGLAAALGLLVGGSLALAYAGRKR